jgi:Protein of unknown function (DUF3034)
MRRAAIVVAQVVSMLVACTGVASAGVPFINLEGVGGVAFNPVAYPAAESEEGLKLGALEIAKPRIGAWYVNLNDSSIDWPTVGVATAFNHRVETSFGYESVAIGKVYNVHKVNAGAKVVLLDENAFGSKAVPALAVGGVFKRTSLPEASRAAGSSDAGVDLYAVATKLVTELPRPVLLSAGVLSTKAMVDGITGFTDAGRKLVVFGNVDVVPLPWLALGVEYKMGPSYSNGYTDGDYFNVHAGWFVSPKLTLAVAYTHAGARSADPVGFGGGFVLGSQYAF